MRFKKNGPQLSNTVLLSGWLFADLFLALAVIFLSANTAGIRLRPVPTPVPTIAIVPTPIPTPMPTATPTSAPLPRLEIKANRITLENIDTTGLLNDSPTATNDLKQQIRSQGFLQGRTVGLVIIYGGAPDDTQIQNAQNIVLKVQDVLRSLGRDGFAFSRTSYYDPLYRLGDPATTIVIDVYLYQ